MKTHADFHAIVAALREQRHQASAALDRARDLVGPDAWPDFCTWLMREFDILALGAMGEATVDANALTTDQARASRCVLVRLPDGSERLAMADPWDDEAVTRVAAALNRWPRLAAPAGALLRDWLGEADEAPAPRAKASPRPAATMQGPAPDEATTVVAFVESAIRNAVEQGASDIHFECDREGLVLKLRCDGVLRQQTRWDQPSRAEQVISRIKVMAQLDITETRIPQDGRLRVGSAEHSLDLRVSIMPSIHGEDAVLRLLDRSRLAGTAAQISLGSLGFAGAQAETLRALAGLPHGMLLMTGPTGSGKTTTVYAALSEINNGEEKIVTIEDPVEYELPGVLQIPVTERKGLTFAKGLRSILRHDPDRILVGEIRDSETAEIAVQSALTGHLVFTTVHANSLFDVTGRFRHFGIDMFAFMSALNGVVVQRLIRCLCTQCRSWRPLRENERTWLGRHGEDGWVPPERAPVAQGCAACGGTGYAGRTVLAEVHVIDDAFRDLVVNQAPITALHRHVEQRGVRSLFTLATEMVSSGSTTMEEVRRVVGWI